MARPRCRPSPRRARRAGGSASGTEPTGRAGPPELPGRRRRCQEGGLPRGCERALRSDPPRPRAGGCGPFSPRAWLPGGRLAGGRRFLTPSLRSPTSYNARARGAPPPAPVRRERLPAPDGAALGAPRSAHVHAESWARRARRPPGRRPSAAGADGPRVRAPGNAPIWSRRRRREVAAGAREAHLRAGVRAGRATGPRQARVCSAADAPPVRAAGLRPAGIAVPGSRDPTGHVTLPPAPRLLSRDPLRKAGFLQ